MYNAMVRLNIPAVYLCGGPMLAGHDNTDLITIFEGVGKNQRRENVRRGAAQRLAEQRLPRLRQLRRHVHGQFHELPG